MGGPDRLRDALARGPLVLDAAMGTRLIARGLDLARDDPGLWALDRPDDVLDVHRRDVRAGSDAILTDTFGANRDWLDRFGRGGDVAAINRRAVALAREAAGPDRLVLGSIGPAAVRSPAYREQADLLAESGVDALILETHSPSEAGIGLARLRDLGRLPLLVSLHVWPPRPGDEARRLLDLGAAALGGNCQDGMGPALALAEALHRETAAPLLLKPSAGLPGRPPAGPESFAEAVPRLLALGVRLLGGCCGTAEAHVAALRAAIEDAGMP